MVDAANLETRLSVVPPAPFDQSDDSGGSEAIQGLRPAPSDTSFPADDSIDLSDGAQAIGPIPEGAAGASVSEFAAGERENDESAQNDTGIPIPAENSERPAADDGIAARPTLQTSATEPISPDTDDPLETNQVSSRALEEAGNDTRNETEAGRTLGQVIDVFA